MKFISKLNQLKPQTMETKVKKSKKWKYHITHTFTIVKGDQKITFATQLYKIGVYAIINNDSAMQMNLKPQDVVKIEKKVQKDFELGIVKDLKFGREIVVSDETGFFEEVTE
jgi:hypothetical protein